MKNYLSWVFVLVIGIVVIVLPSAFIYLLNEQPTTSHGHRTLLTPKVKQGEEFQIEIVTESDRGCDAIIYRSLIDFANHETTFGASPRSKEAKYTVKLRTDPDAALGPAIYAAKAEWHCNIVQDWFPNVIHAADIDFEIVSR